MLSISKYISTPHGFGGASWLCDLKRLKEKMKKRALPYFNQDLTPLPDHNKIKRAAAQFFSKK